MRTDFSSPTLGWNIFPVPPLIEHDKADLTRVARRTVGAGGTFPGVPGSTDGPNGESPKQADGASAHPATRTMSRT